MTEPSQGQLDRAKELSRVAKRKPSLQKLIKQYQQEVENLQIRYEELQPFYHEYQRIERELDRVNGKLETVTYLESIEGVLKPE
jgi:uncharacterized protein YlxW (UPF0749 family)